MFNVKESEYGKQPFHLSCFCCWGCPDGSGSKESACNAGDQGSTPGSGRSPGERNGYPLQVFSC